MSGGLVRRGDGECLQGEPDVQGGRRREPRRQSGARRSRAGDMREPFSHGEPRGAHDVRREARRQTGSARRRLWAGEDREREEKAGTAKGRTPQGPGRPRPSMQTCDVAFVVSQLRSNLTPSTHPSVPDPGRRTRDAVKHRADPSPSTSGPQFYSGRFPCFLRGEFTILFSSMAKLRMRRSRVSLGLMTSST